MAAVEGRYAAALLEAMPSRESAEEAGNTLAQFQEAMEQLPELRRFLTNPVIPAPVKKETIGKILGADCPRQVHSLLCLLLDKGRLPVLPEIRRRYEQRRLALMGAVSIFVTSALPLEPRELEAIRRGYAAKYGAALAHVEQRVDPSLLGGMRVQIGDLLIDSTLSGRLRGLRQAVSAADSTHTIMK